MDPGLTPLKAKPRRSARAARRRTADVAVLIDGQMLYELDPLMDLVWKETDGRHDLGEIAERCAAALELELGSALVGVAITVRFFVREGLMTL